MQQWATLPAHVALAAFLSIASVLAQGAEPRSANSIKVRITLSIRSVRTGEVLTTSERVITVRDMWECWNIMESQQAAAQEELKDGNLTVDGSCKLLSAE